MKKLLTFLTAAVLALSLAACGGGGSQPTALEQEAVSGGTASPELARELLVRDYEIYYLVCFGGLELDYSDEREGYFAVAQEGYTTRAALEKVLLATYTREGADMLLSSVDAVGRSLFAEFDGKLYRSGSGSAFGMAADYDDDSIALAETTGESCNITFTETQEDGSARECSLPMVNEGGGWRLAMPRVLLGGEVSAAADTPLAAAQGLLSALLSGDTDAIAYYAGMPQGAYDSWRGVEVKRAEIVETLDENETGGSYIAALSAGSSYGLLLNGDSRYRIIVESRFIDEEDAVRSVVVHFQPEENDPYNYLALEARDDAACNMVMDYLSVYGEQGFASVSALSAHDVTDFSLYMLDKENSGGAFTAEETSAAMRKYFGSTAEPSRECYSEGAGGYVFYGRGAADLRYELSRSVTKNGVTTVGVDFYTDNLQTQGHDWLTFTLAANGDGSYRFVSAER